MEDSRITALRGMKDDIADRADDGWEQDVQTIDGALAYADERLKINLGLITENAGLKQKIGAPPTLDLSTIPSVDLLAELTRRLEDRQ